MVFIAVNKEEAQQIEYIKNSWNINIEHNDYEEISSVWYLLV